MSAATKFIEKRTEVLLTDDLKQYLYNRYAADGLTPSEVESIILMLRNISGTIYEANKAVLKSCFAMVSSSAVRTEPRQTFIWNLLISTLPENNIFKAVNQFEIEGINNQLRIPDGIVFVNGIPVVVFEFKSAVKRKHHDNGRLQAAYGSLPQRYSGNLQI